jgi:hypothetical protein
LSPVKRTALRPDNETTFELVVVGAMTVVGIARGRRPLRALTVSIHSRGATGGDERASRLFNHRLQ